jgi:dephospho-CoA kinase
MKPNGSIDRIAVRNQLFAYPNVKRTLQNLNKQLNPIIWKVLNEDINRMITNEDEIVLVEVPLLFEAQWHKLFEYTVAVWAPRGIQYERLMARTNNDKKLVDIMLTAQMSAALKLAKADFGLINTKNHAHLIRQCIVLATGLQDLIWSPL